MRYSRVYLEAMGYELAPNVVSSAWIEERLRPAYERLGYGPGRLEMLTGIRERRWWDAGHANAQGAIRAGRRALEAAGMEGRELGALIYAGVNRDHVEPATACAVAADLGLPADAEIYDVSNACLGVLNGVAAIANRIELGQARAGMVVACETAREINEATIRRLNESGGPEEFRLSLATFTGGSGAAAAIVSDGSFGRGRPRLAAGAMRAAPEHHAICRWEFGNSDGRPGPQFTRTDAAAVLRHGVELGRETWGPFLEEAGWARAGVDRTVCHQVGASHRAAILAALGVDAAQDFATYEYLGNMGTVSLPLTAALAEERGFLSRGQRVAFLGIGSGLNCMMMGWEW